MQNTDSYSAILPCVSIYLAEDALQMTGQGAKGCALRLYTRAFSEGADVCGDEQLASGTCLIYFFQLFTQSDRPQSEGLVLSHGRKVEKNDISIIHKKVISKPTEKFLQALKLFTQSDRPQKV